MSRLIQASTAWKFFTRTAKEVCTQYIDWRTAVKTFKLCRQPIMCTRAMVGSLNTLVLLKIRELSLDKPNGLAWLSNTIFSESTCGPKKLTLARAFMNLAHLPSGEWQRFGGEYV